MIVPLMLTNLLKQVIKLVFLISLDFSFRFTAKLTRLKCRVAEIGVLF